MCRLSSRGNYLNYKMDIYLMDKRGVSPVIATVLLISMVVVLATIVILWFTSLTGEAITKFDGQNVEIVCNDVSFDATYTGNVLSVLNTGSVPIYRVNVKAEGVGGHDTQQISPEDDNWPSKGLNQGKSFLASKDDFLTKEKLTVIPVLLGESSEGLKTFSCEEKSTGYEINVL